MGISVNSEFFESSEKSRIKHDFLDLINEFLEIQTRHKKLDRRYQISESMKDDWWSQYGTVNHIDALRQIIKSKLGTFGFLESFNYNLSGMTDYEEGSKWFLANFARDNTSPIADDNFLDDLNQILKLMNDIRDFGSAMKQFLNDHSEYFSYYDNYLKYGHYNSIYLLLCDDASKIKDSLDG